MTLIMTRADNVWTAIGVRGPPLWLRHCYIGLLLASVRLAVTTKRFISVDEQSDELSVR